MVLEESMKNPRFVQDGEEKALEECCCCLTSCWEVVENTEPVSFTQFWDRR